MVELDFATCSDALPQIAVWTFGRVEASHICAPHVAVRVHFCHVSVNMPGPSPDAQVQACTTPRRR